MIKKIGVIGTGVMGSMLSLLFAEHAEVDVSIFDLSEANMLAAARKAEEAGLGHRIHICRDIRTLCRDLDSPRVFFFSLPHGGPGDGVVKSLTPHLAEGDIIIDGSNEDYKVTQKRQGWLQSRGVSYIGMGVSGGFAGARNGPSLMPSGDNKALDLLMPLFRNIAAKDDQRGSCVAKIGPGGSGHYVKMIHNGIEHGMMSVLCEAWALMDNCLKMDGDEIGQVFDSWNQKGELVRQLSDSKSMSCVLTSYGRATTFSLQLVVPFAGPGMQTEKGICYMESEIQWSKMPMTPRVQEYGQTWKLYQLTFPPRV